MLKELLVVAACFALALTLAILSGTKFADETDAIDFALNHRKSPVARYEPSPWLRRPPPRQPPPALNQEFITCGTK